MRDKFVALLFLSLFSLTVKAEVWNIASDYSKDNNPNGVWSYGRRSSIESTDFLIFCCKWGSSGWWMNNPGNGGPSIQAVSMWAKGNGNGYPVFRWTAPKNGKFNIAGRFTAWSLGGHNYVYIVINGKKVFAAHITTPSGTADYTFSNISLIKGNTVDYLTVWDGVGDSESPWINVGGTIQEIQPIFSALTAFPTAGSVPLDVDFNVRATSKNGPITQYLWDVNGDGYPDEITTTGHLQYTYKTNGAYNARVQVVDSAGASAIAPKPVKISVGSGPELSGQVEYYSYDNVAKTMVAKVRIYNTGDTDAPPFNTSFIISDNGQGASTFKTTKTLGLAAGQNTLLDVTYTFPESIYGRRVSVTIDSGRKVKEVNETNNGAFITIAPLATR